MEGVDTIVIGSPVYWHNLCVSVRNVLDRFYGWVEKGALAGRRLFFVFQGAGPEKWMLEAGEYTMKRFAFLYGMTWMGMATSRQEAATLGKEVEHAVLYTGQRPDRIRRGPWLHGMSHAYGAPADTKEMTELLARAVDMGYTFFDTAEVYGTPEDPHANEALVGAALKPFRSRVVIATKFGIRFDTSSPAANKPLLPDSRPEIIRAAVEASLRRLHTDHIDLYYQHRQDPRVPVEDVAGVMQQLMREGKITHWGLSEVTEDTLCRAHAVCPVTAVQNRYSMMARWYENLFPVLEELGIGYVAFSPLANGFLSGRYDKTSRFDSQTDYRSVMPQFQPESIDRNQALLSLLNNLAGDMGAPPAQISLAWMLCRKPYLVPIPGTRRPERLRENAEAADIALSAEDISAIDRALDGMDMSPVFGGTPVAKA